MNGSVETIHASNALLDGGELPLHFEVDRIEAPHRALKPLHFEVDRIEAPHRALNPVHLPVEGGEPP